MFTKLIKIAFYKTQNHAGLLDLFLIYRKRKVDTLFLLQNLDFFFSSLSDPFKLKVRKFLTLCMIFKYDQTIK